MSLEYIQLVVFVCIAAFARVSCFFLSSNTKLRVDGLIFATFQLKVCLVRFFLLFSVLLLLLLLIRLLLLFFGAPACEPLLITFLFCRKPKEMLKKKQQKNERANSTTALKKNWAKRRRFMFYRVVGWLACVCVCVCLLLSFGLPHLIGIQQQYESTVQITFACCVHLPIVPRCYVLSIFVPSVRSLSFFRFKSFTCATVDFLCHFTQNYIVIFHANFPILGSIRRSI